VKEPNFVQIIDLKKYHSHEDGSIEYNHQEVDRGEMCYFALPMDMPAYLRAYRLLSEIDSKSGGEIKALEGWLAEFDAFTLGVKVFVRIDRGGTLKVFAEDSEGIAKLGEWSRE
jgi:hypothetical protein